MYEVNGFENLNLYFLKNVIVTLKDGREVQGNLRNISLTTKEISVGDEVFSVDELADVEMTGNVIYHTYAKIPERACEISGLFFGVDDFVPGTDLSKVVFDEFGCTAACHLFFEDQKIVAKDVRVLSFARKFSMKEVPSLKEVPHLFVMPDGTMMVGVMHDRETLLVRKDDGLDVEAVGIKIEEVLEIIRLPQTNEFVEITLKDDTVVSGTVSASNHEMIVLIGETICAVPLKDLRAIRYKGTLSISTVRLANGPVKQVHIGLGVQDEAFLCKIPYFRTEEDRDAARDGGTATFIPAVTNRGLIAKDVVVEKTEAADGEEIFETGIIIISPTFNRSLGYIGKNFVTKTYSMLTNSAMPRGDLSFSADQLSDELLSGIDPQFIHIVKYRRHMQDMIPKAWNIELQERIPVSECAKVWIDEHGKVQKLPVSVLFLDKFLNKIVDVETNDGECMSGTLTEVSAETLTIAVGDVVTLLKKEDVLRVFFHGVVTAYQGNGTGFISGQYWYHVNNFVNRDQIEQHTVGSKVRFTFEVSKKGNLCAAAKIEIEGNPEPEHFDEFEHKKKGYVVFLKNPGTGRGFLVEPQDLDACLKSPKREGNLYFQRDDIDDLGGFNVDTTKYYYEVSYVPGDGNQVYNVKFLREYPVSKPVAVQTPVAIVRRTETLKISEFAEPTVALKDMDYQYGLINIHSTRYALINIAYYNNNYYRDDNMYGDAPLPVLFNPEQVQVLPEEPRVITKKHTYLVRYVQKGTAINTSTGEEHPTVDVDCPIEVVCKFPKNQCASIVLEGDTITIERIETTTVATGSIAPPLPNKPLGNDKAPAFVIGEGVYFQLSDGTECYDIYCGESDDAYLLLNGNQIEKAAVARLYRFGVVTDLNISEGTATINHYVNFHLNVAESKMVSILKNQKGNVRMHVMYCCEDEKISEVCRVSKQCLGALAWDTGTVTGHNATENSIAIDITDDVAATHYLTVMSDGVSPYVKNGTIMNRSVFVKQVSHPFENAGCEEPEIVASAVDVRCEEEDLVIRYDDGKDMYYGYRNATIMFPVFGSSKALQDNLEQSMTVRFQVAVTDTAALEGYIDDGEDDYFEVEETFDPAESSDIQNEALSRLLLYKEDVERAVIGIREVDENGRLRDEDVPIVVQKLIDQSKRMAALKVALEYRRGDLVKAEQMLRSEIHAKCKAVALDRDSLYGEQAYYIFAALSYPLRPGFRRKKEVMRQTDYLYWLFLRDFKSREDVVRHIQRSTRVNEAMCEALFREPCLYIDELVAHMMMLDRTNLDKICSYICNNKVLADAVLQRVKGVSNDIAEPDVAVALFALRDKYTHDKNRFSKRVADLIKPGNGRVCETLKKRVGSMRKRFLELLCRDDRDRFERLADIYAAVLDYINMPGFAQQEQLLQTAYRDIGALEEDILARPSKEALEMLLSSADGVFDMHSNILETVKAEICKLLNELYQDTAKPNIRCYVNEQSILPESKSFWLIIENGSENENLQPAENLSLELQSFTDGLVLPEKVRLKQTHLPCGDRVAAEVELELNEEASGVLAFGWTAEYDYTTGFQNNGTTVRMRFKQESEKDIQLQVDSGSSDSKKTDAVNPYAEPAAGAPLSKEEMFFGRKEEKAKILGAICKGDTDKDFIPGAAVVIHGQKKSGKTSLVNQIKNDITADEQLSSKAIFLDFVNILSDTGGVSELYRFQRTLYTAVMARFKTAIKRKHPDVMAMLKENEVDIPNLRLPEYWETWQSTFTDFFDAFQELDKGRHTVVLFMDEFTSLCTALLTESQRSPEKTYLTEVLKFIKTFAQYGFIQIIIGHEAMMRALGTLGVLNHTSEFAVKVEIGALKEEEARELIKKPMEATFGYNVYDTPLGEQAVERLLDLSGCHPAYLMRLCNRLFRYYTDPDKCPRTQLLFSDVNAMVQDYIGDLELSDFDILLIEDGDGAEEMHERDTYKYLDCVVRLSLKSYDRRTADSAEVTRELKRMHGYDDQQIEKTRSLLEGRRVIAVTHGGRVKINTGLFMEYVQQKNGLK